MGNTHVLHIHSGAWLRYEKEPSYIICRKMDGTGEGGTIRKTGKCVLFDMENLAKTHIWHGRRKWGLRGRWHGEETGERNKGCKDQRTLYISWKYLETQHFIKSIHDDKNFKRGVSPQALSLIWMLFPMLITLNGPAGEAFGATYRNSGVFVSVKRFIHVHHRPSGKYKNPQRRGNPPKPQE